MATTVPAPIMTHVVTPDKLKEDKRTNPNAVRYGWCPFKDIDTVGTFGTIEYYVQPESSPYHHRLPKNQLIPFITFVKNTETDDPNEPSTPKDPNPKMLVPETKTALECATTVLFSFSGWGFVVLNSLEGLDQDTATRIFQVVQPFAYPLRDIIDELSFGAAERIESGEDLVFGNIEGFPDEGYVIPALRSGEERLRAHELAAEMLVGAETAVRLATETLDRTDESKTSRIASGRGKNSDDPLDRYLSGELGRETVRPMGKAKESDVEKKVDFLVEREVNREQREEIERLRHENEEKDKQLAELQARQVKPASTAQKGAAKTTGEDGKKV